MSPQWAVIVGTSLLALASLGRGAAADTPVTGPGPGVVMGRILDPHYQTKCSLPVAANTVFAQRVTRIRMTTAPHGALTSAEVRWSCGYPQLDAAGRRCRARTAPVASIGRRWCRDPSRRRLRQRWICARGCGWSPGIGSLPSRVGSRCVGSGRRILTRTALRLPSRPAGNGRRVAARGQTRILAVTSL